MLIRDIMTGDPVYCTPETKLDAVAKLMLDHDCGEIPVCENGTLVGVITDRDIACRALARGQNPIELTAREVMTREVVTVAEVDDLDTAERRMEKHQVRRLPVTRDRKLIGIVSLADLAPQLPSPKVANLVTAVSMSERGA